MKRFVIASDKRFSYKSDIYYALDLSTINSLGVAMEALGKATRDGNAIFLLPQSAAQSTYDYLRLASTKINSLAKNKAIVLQLSVDDETFAQIIDYFCSGSEQNQNLQTVYETASFYCKKVAKENPATIKKSLAHAGV